MTAPRRRSIQRLLLTTLVGAGLGTAIGWMLRGDVSGPASPRTETTGDIFSEQRTQRPNHKAQSPAAAKNGPIKDALLPLLRLLCAADTAAPADMPRLLRAARSMQGVVPFLAQHWAELDAPQMFNTLRAETGSRPLSSDAVVRKALFDTWLAADKEAALAALDDETALPDMSGLRTEAARTVMENEPARSLQLIDKWRLNFHYNDMGGIAAWAARDPVAAADASAKVSLRGVSEHLIMKVAKVWMRTDPVAAMQWAIQHATQYPGSSAAGTMSHVVRLEWDDYDTAAANAFAATITDPAIRVKLHLPPLPRPASRTAPVLPSE